MSRIRDNVPKFGTTKSPGFESGSCACKEVNSFDLRVAEFTTGESGDSNKVKKVKLKAIFSKFIKRIFSPDPACFAL